MMGVFKNYVSRIMKCLAYIYILPNLVIFNKWHEVLNSSVPYVYYSDPRYTTMISSCLRPLGDFTPVTLYSTGPLSIANYVVLRPWKGFLLFRDTGILAKNLKGYGIFL